MWLKLVMSLLQICEDKFSETPLVTLVMADLQHGRVHHDRDLLSTHHGRTHHSRAVHKELQVVAMGALHQSRAQHHRALVVMLW